MSELNANVCQTLEKQYSLLWLQGEVSNFTAHSSGHFYFCLKDKRASVRCVMLKSFNRSLKFELKEGLEVLAFGKVTLYQTRGDYQIFCHSLRPKGLGDLQLAFRQLKEKLQKEGFFDPDRKRPLPFLPEHIAIVTSPTGAAIRDILNVLKRRFKALRVTLIPSLVQGDQAPAALIESLRKAALLKNAEVLILARGGGSIEDLWCFNEEKLVRAIADFPYPVVSAVGHEVDFTLSDFAADVRAPTPSAAAELVTKEAQNLIEVLKEKRERMEKFWMYKVHLWKENLQALCHRVSLSHPENKIKDSMILCDERTQKLEQLMHFRLKEWTNSLGRLTTSLNHLNPMEVLKRGFVIVKKQGRFVHEKSQLKKGEEIQLSFSDGEVKAKIHGI